jgi:hypothetical protein
MASRPRLGRFARVIGAGMLLAAILPAAASAAPSPDQCASNRAITFSATVPDGLRTVGTKDVQWRATFTEAATGQLLVDDGIFNEVTIDPAAPIYPNNVLIRLFRSTTILANGDIIFVPAMNPAQPARMHANVSWLPDEKFFTGPFVLDFRYETKNNHWSAWYPTTAGPETSFCPELTKAIWKQNYGWQEG